MPQTRRSPLLRYGVAPVAVAVAHLARALLGDVLGPEVPLLFSWPAVTVAAWYGGLGPGLLATGLAALAAGYLLFEPRGAVAVDGAAHLVGLALFGLLGACLSVLFERLHRARRRLEAHAREVGQDREWLRVTLASIGDAVIATDRDGGVAFLNAVARDLTGWSEGEALGRPLERVFPILDGRTREPAENPVREVLQAGAVVELADHTILLGRDGGETPIEDNAAPIRDGRGEILGVVLVFRDITERRRAEAARREALDALERRVAERTEELTRANAALRAEVEERRQIATALRASEARFRLIVAGVRDYAILMLDPQGHVASWNEGAERIKGYRPEEILGRHFSCFYTSEDVERGHPARGLAGAEACGRFEDQGWRVRKDGTRFWADVILTAMRDDAGRLIGFSKITRDVTERRQAEEQLRAFAARLERSNRELEEFASVASHDLQEPLRKIQAFGDRLRARSGEALGEQGRDDLGRMQAAAGRLRSLIDDLLSFSRVTTKARPFVPVDLDRLAREVLSDLEGRVQQAGAVVEVDGLPIVEGDPTQLRQLLQNLFGNALKFHRPGVPPTLRVRGRLLEAPPEAPGDGPEAPGRCELAVSDDGIGFDEKYLDRIFNVFQRLHGRHEYEGTGMGLAICRKIVAQHAGTITARSAPGRGATFLVTLPIHNDHAEEPP